MRNPDSGFLSPLVSYRCIMLCPPGGWTGGGATRTKGVYFEDPGTGNHMAQPDMQLPLVPHLLSYPLFVPRDNRLLSLATIFPLMPCSVQVFARSASHSHISITLTTGGDSRGHYLVALPHSGLLRA